jgi:hypothetical protein
MKRKSGKNYQSMAVIFSGMAGAITTSGIVPFQTGISRLMGKSLPAIPQSGS